MARENTDLCTVVDIVPVVASHRRWTLRVDNHAHHHCVVRLGESPLYLELSWRATKTAPVKPVGLFRLDLYGLLRNGFVRPEGHETPPSLIRLRIVQAEDKHFYI